MAVASTAATVDPAEIVGSSAVAVAVAVTASTVASPPAGASTLLRVIIFDGNDLPVRAISVSV